MILIVLGARRVKALKEKKTLERGWWRDRCRSFQGKLQYIPIETLPGCSFNYFPPNVAPWFGKWPLPTGYPSHRWRIIDVPRLDSILKLIYRCTKAEAQGKRWPPVSGQNLYNLRYECLEFTIKTCGHCTIVPYIVPKIWSLEPCSPCLFRSAMGYTSGVRRWDWCFGAGVDLSDFGRLLSFLCDLLIQKAQNKGTEDISGTLSSYLKIIKSSTALSIWYQLPCFVSTY